MTKALTVQEQNELKDSSRTTAREGVLYGLWISMSLIPFMRPLGALTHFALQNDNASHILLIPFICAWIVYVERRSILSRVSFDFPSAAFFVLLAALFYGWTVRSGANWSLTDRLTGYMLALLLLWIAGFALFFGRTALKAGRFPLFFLFLAVPLPEFLLNPSIFFLQKGSAEITAVLFDVSGVPFLREGFVFHLARVNIEVARECSGIRSSMALFILALLVGHFYLRASWRKIVLVLCGILIMVVKNGVRIVILTLLAIYVNPGFLFGRLHHDGGVLFFLLGLLLLAPILWLLRRGETPEVAVMPSPTQSVQKPSNL